MTYEQYRIRHLELAIRILAVAVLLTSILGYIGGWVAHANADRIEQTGGR